jgi:hypothetical protein
MRGSVVIAVVCLMGAGCDGVFGLRHFDDPPDGHPCVAVGHDEDNDGLDDGCDPCPFDTNNSGDDDHDGIALACDPDPTVPNRVLLFTGFGPGSTSGFGLERAEVTSDAVHTIVGGENSYVVWNMGDVDDVWVMTAFHVSSLLAGATFREVGVAFDTQPAASNSDHDGTYCVLDKSTGDFLKIYKRETAIPMDTLLASQASPFDLAKFSGTMIASYTRTGSPQVTCAFSSGVTEASIGATRTPVPPTGKLLLYGDDADADIPYLFIVTKS